MPGRLVLDARTEARARRALLNKIGHAASKAAAEYRRSAAHVGEHSRYYDRLVALAEQQEAIAAEWEALRPTVPRRRQPKPARVLTADERAFLEAGGIDVDQLLAAAAYARADAAASRRRRR